MRTNLSRRAIDPAMWYVLVGYLRILTRTKNRLGLRGKGFRLGVYGLGFRSLGFSV